MYSGLAEKVMIGGWAAYRAEMKVQRLRLLVGKTGAAFSPSVLIGKPEAFRKEGGQAAIAFFSRGKLEALRKEDGQAVMAFFGKRLGNPL